MKRLREIEKLHSFDLVEYNPDIEINEQRKIICEYLQKEITKLAQELPLHIVIPYNNIKKKNYPKSK